MTAKLESVSTKVTSVASSTLPVTTPAKLPPIAKPSITATKPVTLQTKPAETAKYTLPPGFTTDNIQVGSEWMDRAAYNTLSPEDQSLIRKLGIEGFDKYQRTRYNDSQAALEAAFYYRDLTGGTTGLDLVGFVNNERGTWYFKDGYIWIKPILPTLFPKPDYKTSYKTVEEMLAGLGYADKDIQDIVAFNKNYVNVPSLGGYVERSYWDKLSKDEQTRINAGTAVGPANWVAAGVAAGQLMSYNVAGGMSKLAADVSAGLTTIKTAATNLGVSEGQLSTLVLLENYKTGDGYRLAEALNDGVNEKELVDLFGKTAVQDAQAQAKVLAKLGNSTVEEAIVEGKLTPEDLLALGLMEEGKALTLAEAKKYISVTQTMSKLKDYQLEDGSYDLGKIMQDIFQKRLDLNAGHLTEAGFDKQAVKDAIAAEGKYEVKALAKEYRPGILKAQSISRTYLDWTLPGYGSQRHWHEMKGWQKGLSVAGDVLVLLPALKAAATAPGAIARGATVTSQLGKVGVGVGKSIGWGAYAAGAVVETAAKVGFGPPGTKLLGNALRLAPKDIRVAGTAAKGSGKALAEASEKYAELQKALTANKSIKNISKLSAKAQEAVQKAQVADGLFIEKLGNIDKITKPQLKALEELSGFKGLAKHISNITKQRAALKNYWAEIEHLRNVQKNLTALKRMDYRPQSANASQLAKTFTKAQKALNKLENSLDDFEALMQKRGTQGYRVIALPSQQTLKDVKQWLRSLPKSQRSLLRLRTGRPLKLSDAPKFEGFETQMFFEPTGKMKVSIRKPIDFDDFLKKLSEKHPKVADEMRTVEKSGAQLEKKLSKVAVAERPFEAASKVEIKPELKTTTKKVVKYSDDVRKGPTKAPRVVPSETPVWAVGKPFTKVVIAGTEWVAPSELVKTYTETKTQIRELDELKFKIQEIQDPSLQTQALTWVSTGLQNLTQQALQLETLIQEATETQTKTETLTKTKTLTKIGVKTKLKTSAIRRGKGRRGLVPPFLIPPSGSGEDSELQIPPGAAGWKQGAVYWHIWPENNELKKKATRKPVAGIPYKEGIGSAYASLRKTHGELPKLMGMDMGIMDVYIQGDQREPKMKVRQDLQRRTRLNLVEGNPSISRMK